MMFQKKIEQFLEIIQGLEQTFTDAKDKEIFPISFFSSSIDTVNRLRTCIYEIEALQFKMMQEHLKKSESESFEENTVNEFGDYPELNVKEGRVMEPEVSEKKVSEDISISSVNILANTISRKIIPDFGKSLSLNDKFMFQRELFQGDVLEMNSAFEQLNKFQSLSEALAFLTGKYSIPWESDTGIVFREILEKRFA